MYNRRPASAMVKYNTTIILIATVVITMISCALWSLMDTLQSHNIMQSAVRAELHGVFGARPSVRLRAEHRGDPVAVCSPSPSLSYHVLHSRTGIAILFVISRHRRVKVFGHRAYTTITISVTCGLDNCSIIMHCICTN